MSKLVEMFEDSSTHLVRYSYREPHHHLPCMWPKFYLSAAVLIPLLLLLLLCQRWMRYRPAPLWLLALGTLLAVLLHHQGPCKSRDYHFGKGAGCG